MSHKYSEDRIIQEIDRSALKKFEEEVKTEKIKSGKVISKNTISFYNNQLVVIFNYFVDKNYLKENPFEHKETQINDMITLPDKDIKKILKKLKNKNVEHYKVITLLLISAKVKLISSLTLRPVNMKVQKKVLLIFVRNREKEVQK